MALTFSGGVPDNPFTPGWMPLQNRWMTEAEWNASALPPARGNLTPAEAAAMGYEYDPVRGQWVPPEPPPMPPPPPPQEGEYKYFDNVLYRYIGGRWMPQTSTVEQPPGGGTTGGGNVPTGSDLISALSEQDLGAQFLNLLGIPTWGASPFQKWQVQQAAPTMAAYGLQTRLSPETSFADYLGGGQGIMGARRALPGLYEGLLGGEVGLPEQARQSLGSNLWNAMMERVATTKFGPLFGPTLAGGLRQEQAQYQATPFGMQAPAERGFLEYLRGRYGL